MDDQAVYDMISEGETDGVFQLEGGGMRQFLTNMKPGLLRGHYRRDFAVPPRPDGVHPALYRGQAEPRIAFTTRTPKLKPDPGRHLRLHGLSGAGDADRARSGRLLDGPKRPGAPRHGQEKARRHGAGEGVLHPRQAERRTAQSTCPARCGNGVSEEVAEHLFDEMTAFASYAFNKSARRGATPWSPCRPAWLKRTIPRQFMAAHDELASLITPTRSPSTSSTCAGRAFPCCRRTSTAVVKSSAWTCRTA